MSAQHKIYLNNAKRMKKKFTNILKINPLTTVHQEQLIISDCNSDIYDELRVRRTGVYPFKFVLHGVRWM